MSLIVLGSGGLRTPERVASWVNQVRATLGPTHGRILFIPYALADHDGYCRMVVERGLNAGFPIEPIHRCPDPTSAVRSADAVFVGGGNTFRLLAQLYRYGLIDAIRERMRSGVPYLGISAGTNVAGPTIRTTNDMPIVQPPTLNALGLVPFQINPHFLSGETFVKVDGQLVQHFGETREDRLREFHEENATPVLGLWEGSVLRVVGSHATLSGAAARLFRRGEPAIDYPPGSDLSHLLG